MPSPPNLFASTLASFVRGFSGINSRPATVKPAEFLELYDVENSPYCRLVREALTELDLDAVIKPCPRGGSRFRDEVVERGGKAQFPYLVDPNTGEAMYESLDIVAYLFETYGQRELPLRWRAEQLQTLSSVIASGFRLLNGGGARASQPPERNLELYSFEGSPYARPVRELLCRLEMPYVLRSCGRSRLDEWLLPQVRKTLGVVPDSDLVNRRALQDKEGNISIPYLYDPNTDTGLFESDKIMGYLESNYAVR